MPQPTISGAPLTCKFGGLTLPHGQGTMAQVNLNDTVNWQWQAFQGDDDYPQLTIGQLAWRGRSRVIGRDRSSRVLTLPMRYQEDGSHIFGAAKAQLLEAAAQRLTFDNATYIGAEVQAVKNESMLKAFSPFWWACELEFLCPDPHFYDLTPTAIGSQALASGSATTFNVTYAGSVWAEPVWTLTIPGANTAPIASFSLSNTMSGEALSIVFPGGLAGSTAWTITIDAGQQTVTGAGGTQYDFSGSFPMLYGPAGQVNAMSATLMPASGTATSCTISGSVTNRWLL